MEQAGRWHCKGIWLGMIALAVLVGLSPVAAQDQGEEPADTQPEEESSSTPASAGTPFPATLPDDAYLDEDFDAQAFEDGSFDDGASDEAMVETEPVEDAPVASQPAAEPTFAVPPLDENGFNEPVPSAARPTPSGPPLQTPGAMARPYRVLIRDVAGLATLPFREPEDIETATRLIRDQDPHEIAKGWFAHHAILAANQPLYFTAIRRQARFMGGDNFVAWIQQDRSRLRAAPGYDAAILAILDAVNAETRRMAAMGNLLLARALDMQSTRLDDTALFSRVDAENAEDLSVNYDLRRELDPETLSARSRETLDRVMEVAALLILGRSEPETLSRIKQVVGERRMDYCVTEARLNFSRCISATRFDEERAFCIGRHGVEELGACWRTLLTQRD